jgi:hypothetical protein
MHGYGFKTFGAALFLLATTAGAVKAANTPPMAEAQAVSCATASAKNHIWLQYSDPDAHNYDDFRFIAVTLPANGTLQYREYQQYDLFLPIIVGAPVRNGWYYTPNPGFVGSDSFAWKVNDGQVDSNVAACSITINANVAPTANDQDGGAVIGGTLRKSCFLSYADPDFGQNHVFTFTVLPSHGKLEYYDHAVQNYMPLNAPGIVPCGGICYYTPNADYAGADHFQWQVNDEVADSNVAAYSFTVTVNTVPTAEDVKAVALQNAPVSIAAVFSDPDVGQTMTCKIVANAAHGDVTVSGSNFTYTPTANFTGTDSFTWQVNDGLADSNSAICRIIVRAENSRAGMTVLLIVKDHLLPEINGEVNRLKNDLEREGHAATVKAWAAPDAEQLWQYLVNEYRAAGQFVAGAVLIGNLPVANYTAPNGYTAQTDCALMNMETFCDVSKQHIWVSRIWASSDYSGKPLPGGEVTMIKRALQANHDYRNGRHRLPHAVHYGCWAFPTVEPTYYPNNGANALLVWSEVSKPATLTAAFVAGGELLDACEHGTAEYYGNVNTLSLNSTIAQVRFCLNSSCTSGAFGGVVNRQLFTRGGGNVLSVGATKLTGNDAFIVLHKPWFLERLAAGDSWGNAIVRGYPFFDRHRAVFYGDLSLPAKAAPANRMPTITTLTFTLDTTSGEAPLVVNMSAAADDSDGRIAAYEWFVTGHHYGTVEPGYVTDSNTLTHAYHLPHRYLLRVEVVDDYLARAWHETQIVVGPEPTKPLRIHCGRTLTYFTPGEDFTDGAGRIWLHDQAFTSGTWGYSSGAENYVSQAVAGTKDDLLYQRFREGSSFTYRFPLPNGQYSLNFGFADMKSTASGQRIMDVEAEGVPLITGLDVFAQIGGKKVLIVTKNVTVADGELTVTVKRNAAALNPAFLNCLEIIPTGGDNNAPLISSYSPVNPVTVASETGQQFSVEAWDADGDTLSYAWKLDGASVGSNGNAYTYSPSATEAGSHTIEVTVSDGKGGTVKQTWNVTVTAPTNQAPTVATAAKATPSPATGTTTTLSVLGADDGGEANLTYSWATTGTPPAVVAFSPNGANAAKNTTATFTKAGSYGFQVTIKDAGNLTVTSSVNVTVNQTLTAITVSPATASVNTGATQQFTATAKDQFSANLTTQPTFSWTVSGGGTISSAGLFTPGGTTAGGPYTVTATGGGKSNNATLAVNGDLVVPSVEKYRLTVNLIGGGSGVITLSPAGDVYDAGSVVTLTAVAAAGSEFADWSGDLSGTSDSATITMDADKTVSATFVLGSAAQPPKTHPLTLTKTFVRLNFGKTGSDQILVAGVLPITEGYAVEGRTLTVNFGGVEETFVLNGRGQGKTTGGEFGLRLKQKRGAVVAQQAKFQLQLKNGEFAQALSAAGLTNADSRKAAVTVPVLLTFDGTTYAVDKQLLFSAKADKMGLAK